MLPLSKTLDPADLDQLTTELAIVDQHFTKDSPQHPLRRWEYALALRAHQTWVKNVPIGGPHYDIGGSGSPFYRMLDPYQMLVVDPQELHGQDLAAFVRSGPRLGAAVFCLSVLEHVDDLDHFLYHLSCLVAPGGLLFLTFDYGDLLGGPDTAHFHWMRKRIFTSASWEGLADRFCGDVTYAHGGEHFALLGGVDWAYHGPHVYDYTFASLALTKEP